MIGAARIAAYRALLDVESGRADLPDALARHRLAVDDPRDRALLAEVVTGTLRWQASLDHLIARATGRPLDRLDDEVLAILRLSAYQLRHLERVPPRAIVDDAVNLTRHARVRSAAGFVNAVLRRLSNASLDAWLPPRPTPAGPAAPGSDVEAAVLDYLSITLSHPRWLAERWLRCHGFERTEEWMIFNNRPAPLSLRANTLLISREDLSVRLASHGVSTAAARFAPDGLIVTSGNPLLTPLAGVGLFLLQDEASQLVAVAAGVGPGDRVLDACAAPGGKTVALAADIGRDGLIVAADRREARLSLLRSTLRTCGVPPRLVQLDLTSALPFGRVFDVVVVDAPCSGLGTLRRDPDLRWRRREADFQRFSEAQARMLDNASGGVRPGGRLVYATCSSEPDENEDVVRRFVDGRSDIELIDARTEAAGRLPRAVMDEAGCLRTLPFLHGLEAFFAASLRCR